MTANIDRIKVEIMPWAKPGDGHTCLGYSPYDKVRYYVNDFDCKAWFDEGGNAHADIEEVKEKMESKYSAPLDGPLQPEGNAFDDLRWFPVTVLETKQDGTMGVRYITTASWGSVAMPKVRLDAYKLTHMCALNADGTIRRSVRKEKI